MHLNYPELPVTVLFFAIASELHVIRFTGKLNSGKSNSEDPKGDKESALESIYTRSGVLQVMVGICVVCVSRCVSICKREKKEKKEEKVPSH